MPSWRDGSATATRRRSWRRGRAWCSPWLNLVERLFAEITRQRIRRGVFKSVDDLIAAIEAWITERNRNPKAFEWTANAPTILTKIARARQTLAMVKAVRDE